MGTDRRTAGRRQPQEPPDQSLEPHVRRALQQWPEIDPETEAIVTRIARADRHFRQIATQTLRRLSLTHNDLHVLLGLVGGQRSHGALCSELLVSTGAMTNRLDKLERAHLIRRLPDPNDRRGTLVELTTEGQRTLDEYVTVEAERERKIVARLRPTERRQLATLLTRLAVELEADATAD